MFRVDSDQIKSHAAKKIAALADAKNDRNSLVHLYLNLCFTFVAHGYAAGRIHTGKTRRGTRDYLAQKRNKASYSGGRFNSCIRDLESAGLAVIEDGKLSLTVPESAVSAGDQQSLTKAIRCVSKLGWSNLTPDLLTERDLTVTDVVDAMFHIEQLVPGGRSKDALRQRIVEVLDTSRTGELV